MGHRTAVDQAHPDIPTWLAEEIIETRIWPKSAGFDNSEVTEREVYLLRQMIRARKMSEALQAQVDSV